MRVSNDEIQRRARIEKIRLAYMSSKTQDMEIEDGTKLKPIYLSTDLGTKLEKEARTAEGDMEEEGGKAMRWDEIITIIIIHLKLSKNFWIFTLKLSQ